METRRNCEGGTIEAISKFRRPNKTLSSINQNASFFNVTIFCLIKSIKK